MIHDTGYRIQDTGYMDTGYRIQDKIKQSLITGPAAITTHHTKKGTTSPK